MWDEIQKWPQRYVEISTLRESGCELRPLGAEKEPQL